MLFCFSLALLNLVGLNLVKIIVSKVYKGAYVADSYNPIRPFIEILQIGYFTYLSKEIKNQNTHDVILDTIFVLNEISLIFIQLILISMTMDRLTRPILLLDYALFANNTKFEWCVNRSDIKRIGILIVVGAMTLAFTRPLFIWIFDSNKLLSWLGV